MLKKLSQRSYQWGTQGNSLKKGRPKIKEKFLKKVIFMKNYPKDRIK